MNINIQERIAIGASVAAHCAPCLTWHLQQARAAGVDEAQIRSAIDIGSQVSHGAAQVMQAHLQANHTAAGDCCSGSGCC